MYLTLAADPRGWLTCVMSDGASDVTICVNDAEAASSSLLDALNDAAADGCGECFWQQAGGEYRWMFRRDGDNVRVAVLWCSGAMTGWEHVFWAEENLERLRGQVAVVSPAPAP